MKRSTVNIDFGYVELLNFSLKHEFFDFRTMFPVSFHMEEESQQKLKQLGAILKTGKNGLSVLLERNRMIALEKMEHSPEITFHVHCIDAIFSNVTESYSLAGNKEKHLHVSSSEELKYGQLEDQEKSQVGSVLKVTYSITPASVNLVVLFKAIDVRWTYVLQMKRYSTANELLLESENKRHLFKKKEADQELHFVSKELIEARHRHAQKYQLKERSRIGEKILIKSLPVPDYNQVISKSENEVKMYVLI